MLDIKKIIYRSNNSYLTINIGDECTLEYNNIVRPLDNKIAIEYAFKLSSLIEDWESEYINYTIIDGSDWTLTIVCRDETKKEYNGKAASPENFDAFEMLTNKLIREVLYE